MQKNSAIKSSTRLQNRWANKILVTCLGVLIIAIMPVIPVLAINYSSGTYGSCQYNSCSLTISSNGTLSINITPATGGACSTQDDTVSVLTDDPSGYTLSLTNSSTNTALLKGTAAINSTTATQASPVALVANQWGYRVDGIGGFGAGPTTAQTNVSPDSILFAGVPASNSNPDTIALTSGAADPAVNTYVWYSVCTDTSIASGTYTTQITYTAITN
jgi:hypothetical protein